MRRVLLFVIAATLMCGAASIAALAQEAGDAKEQAVQEAYMKAGMPGIHHTHLKAMAGSWEYVAKMWQDPAAPPTESKGTCERSMILGDRYLYEDFKGDFMGMPFSGIGITGYDNVNEQYAAIWIDNMSTAIMVGNGSCSDDGKKLSIHMTYTDPMTKKSASMRMISTMTDPSKQVAEYYGPGPDGAEFKMMEFTYTRK